MRVRHGKLPAGGFVPAVAGWFLALWLACSGVPAAAGPAYDFPRVEPGIEYIHHRVGDAPWSIHAVKVARSDARFGLVSMLAQGHIYGLASVSEQVASLPFTEGRPLAAVNGDFFVIQTGPYQGDPSGLHVTRGELVSAPTGTSFWIDPARQPHIGRVTSQFRATGPGGLDIAFGLNQQRGDKAAVLYTPAVGESTRTTGGLELVLARSRDSSWLPLRPGSRCRASVTAVRTDGDTPLTPQGMVLSIGPAMASTLPPVTPGMALWLELKTSPDLTGVETALGGGPILLEAGRAGEWQPPQPRHPRTVVGWNDEQLVLAVVDGRQEGLSAGMTYPELASLMLELGCTHAMNLDGGGSSTLWLDGYIMNSPSDGRERRVANSLIVVSVEPSENEGAR